MTPSACPCPPSTNTSPSTLALLPDHKLRAAFFGVHKQHPWVLWCAASAYHLRLSHKFYEIWNVITYYLTVLVNLVVLNDITHTVLGFCALHA
jgi:hypothetical protein